MSSSTAFPICLQIGFQSGSSQHLSERGADLINDQGHPCEYLTSHLKRQNYQSQIPSLGGPKNSGPAGGPPGSTWKMTEDGFILTVASVTIIVGDEQIKQKI